jgi:hypothetical protein
MRLKGLTDPLQSPFAEHYGDPVQADLAMGLKTYRYLRLSMVIVMVALAASVLLLRRHGTHFEQSISAYYYTPAHAVFVGAMVSTGVALTVIKGWTTFEDWCLGIAGVFAPVIAFVPTTTADGAKLSRTALATANNNIAALLVAGWIAWLVVTVITAAGARKSNPRPTTDHGVGEWAKWASVAGMLCLLAAATGLYWWWKSFPDYAHGWSAAAMFAALGAAAVGNGVNSKTPRRHARWYLGVGIGMLIIGITYKVTSIWNVQWSHEVLEVETLEISLFVLFWIIQSRERWNWTVARPSSAVINTGRFSDNSVTSDHADIAIS